LPNRLGGGTGLRGPGMMTSGVSLRGAGLKGVCRLRGQPFFYIDWRFGDRQVSFQIQPWALGWGIDEDNSWAPGWDLGEQEDWDNLFLDQRRHELVVSKVSTWPELPIRVLAEVMPPPTWIRSGFSHASTLNLKERICPPAHPVGWSSLRGFICVRGASPLPPI